MHGNVASLRVRIIVVSFLFALFAFNPLAGAQQPWSDPGTWGGSVPVAGENVVIPVGQHVLLDTNTPDLGGVTVHGTLEFGRQDLQLTADWIVVTGVLQIGSQVEPFSHQAVITLNANDPNENIMGMGTRGIMAMGGNLEMHGSPPSVCWTRMNANAPAGTTQITIADPADWTTSQEIAIAPTDYYQAGGGNSVSMTARLNQVNGVELHLDTPLNAFRWGQLQYATPSGMSLSPDNRVIPPDPSGYTPTVLDERAPIGNLSRNIVVQAPNDTLWNDQGFGCHVMVMRDANGTMGIAHIDGVEIRRGGQRGTLGRYPFHWHMLSYDAGKEIGDATGQYIRNSTVNRSNNRGIVIHGTNGTTVENNVVYDVRGHGIFTEDASERRNLIAGNLVLHVRNPNPGFALKLHEAGAVAGRGSSGFWLSNPDNTVVDNAAGDCDTNGFWMAFPSQTWGLSSGVAIRPDRLRFGVFENNVAFSNGAEGLLLDWAEQDNNGDIFPQSYISTTDGQNPSWPFPTIRRFTIKGCQTWKNGSHGFWDRSVWPDNFEIVSADNCGRFFAGSGDSGVIERCLVVGTSLNHLTNGTDRPNFTGETVPAAFATYHSAFDIKNNIVVNFQPVAETMSGVFATNDYYLRPVELGQFRNLNNLIVQSHPGVKLTAQNSHFALAGALWDPHGFWGGPPGSYFVYDDPFFTHGQTQIQVPPGSISGGVLVNGPFYGFNDFVVNEGNIRWEDFMEIQVNRLDGNLNSVGTWRIDEAQPGWLLAHMRHFATHPSDYYQLEFPTISTVNDLGMSVTGMVSDTDFQVLVIEYSGEYQVDQVYISSRFNYFDDEGLPAGPHKHIYQPLASRQAVIDSPLGETYWHDKLNDLLWVKIRGGIEPTWNPGDYDPDSDEELYREFSFRVLGTECIGCGPFQIAPESATVRRGIQSAGTVADLVESDNVDLTIQRNSAQTAGVIELELETTTTILQPTALTIRVESAGFFRSEVAQRIELYDFVAGSFVEVDTRPASRFNDAVVDASATGDITRFVESATGRLRSRVIFLSTTARQSFSTSVDQIFWTIE